MIKCQLNEFLKKIPLLLMGILLIAPPHHAFAQGGSGPTAADSSCDPDYYDTLEARAWLEAQREITQNQNIISKPDSILEYTCFDSALGALDQAATGLFSEFASLSAPGTTAQNFIQENFDNVHDLLGGRIDGSYSFEGVKTGSYSCDVMNSVWEESKCMNFVDEADFDGFYTLQEYVDNDDKRFPDGSCTKPANWTTERDNLTPDGTAWEEDIIKTFLEQITYSACSDSEPIPTGVKIKRAKAVPSEYDEMVCIMPGCYFEPAEGGGGECKESQPE